MSAWFADGGAFRSLRDPWFLALIALIPFAARWAGRRGGRALRFAPGAAFLADLPRSARARTAFAPRLMAGVGLALLLVACARPIRRVPMPVVAEGLDVVLALDVSSSMLEEDLAPGTTRLAAARDAADAFVVSRPNDKIGLVAFARYPDLRCPLTRDHVAVRSLLADLRPTERDGPEDATGFGAAAAAGARALRFGRGASRVLVLVTDGEENVASDGRVGEIAPAEAADLCREFGVRVYAIAAGAEKAAAGRPPIDTRDLRALAESTGGAYFEVRDAVESAKVYGAIDALETAPTEEPRHRIEETFLPWLLAGIACLILGRLLGAAGWEPSP